MKTKTQLSDFSFYFVSWGLYRVIYTSPVTGYVWKALINDMELIDNTKNEECPKRKDLDLLKYYVKRLGYKYNKKGERVE